MPWLPIVDDCRSAADVRARCSSNIRRYKEGRKPAVQSGVRRLPPIKTDLSDLRATADVMIDYACEIFNAERTAIVTGGKSKADVNARWTAIYMTVKLTGRSFGVVAPCFGQKGHSGIQKPWYRVSEFLVSNPFHVICRAIREIEAVLANKPAPVVEVPELRKVKTAVSLERIINWSTKYFETTRMELMGECRVAKLVTARHIGFYLARKLTSNSTTKIAAKYGGMDHTSIIHGVRKIELKVAEGDEQTLAAVNSFQNSLAEFGR